MERAKQKSLWKKHTVTFHMHSYCFGTKFIWPLFMSRHAVNRKLLFWCYKFFLCFFSIKWLKFRMPFFEWVSFHDIISFKDSQWSPVQTEKIVRSLLKTWVKPSFLSKYSLVASFWISFKSVQFWSNWKFRKCKLFSVFNSSWSIPAEGCFLFF